MNQNGFMFAGKSTADFGMLVEHYPTQSAPKRKRTAVSVPGRNGELHYDEGAFANYVQTYACGFLAGWTTAETAHAIKRWLFSSGKYQRLEDAYDPEHFRLATFAGPLDIENQLNKFGHCTVKFDCAPQYYLKSGEMPIAIDGPKTLYNPYFESKPLITVYAAGDGNLTVEGVTVQLRGISGSIVLDCEMQNAYRITASGIENQNAKIHALEFPTLLPGDNTISWSGGIQRMEIIPRWWEL